MTSSLPRRLIIPLTVYGQCTQHTGVSILGVGGSRPPLRFWAGGSQGGRGRVVNYYYILSCTGNMFESGDFRTEIEQFAQK